MGGEGREGKGRRKGEERGKRGRERRKGGGVGGG